MLSMRRCLFVVFLLVAVVSPASAGSVATVILSAILDTGSLAGTMFSVTLTYDPDQVNPVGESFVTLESFDFLLQGVQFSRNNIFQGGQAIFENGVIDNVTVSFQVILPPNSPVNNITFGFGGPGVIGYIDLNNQSGSGKFRFPSASVQNQYFLTQVADGAGWRTTFNLANPSTATVNYQVQLKDDFGNPLTITAGGQFGSSFDGMLSPGSSATLTSSGAGNLSLGIAQVSTTAPIVASGVFSSRASGRPDFEAAVPALSSPGQSFLLPFDNQSGKATGLALANTGNSTVSITFTFRTEGGSTFYSASLNLNSKAKTEFFLSEKFPQTQGQRGTVVIAAASPVLAALGLCFLPGGAFTTLPVYPTDSSAVITRQVLSHVIDGGGWQSIISIVNLDSAPASFTVRIFDTSGNPLSLSLNGTVASVFNGTVPAFSSITMITPATSGTLLRGWSDITSNQRIRAQVTFVSSVPGQPMFEAAVPAIADGQGSWAIPFDNSNGLATGIAVVNSGAAPSSVQIAVRDQNGGVTDNKILSLAAGEKRSFMLTEMAPNSAGNRGLVQLSTQNSSISASALRFNGAAFTALPVASADPAAAPPMPVQ
jgi:hypothetical protein